MFMVTLLRYNAKFLILLLYNIGYFGNIINLPDFVVDIHQEISHFPILTENIEISDSEFVYEIRHI